MRWLYYTKHPWQPGGIPAQEINLRAVDPGSAEGEEIRVSRIIQLYVFALDFYFLQAKENPLDNEKGRYIYEEELNRKNFHIEDLDIPDGTDHFLRRAAIYLKTDRFDEEELLDWAGTYLSINGFPFEGFERGDSGAFSELNPLSHLFSLENVKKFEDKFGKEWWKRKKPDDKP